MVKAEHDTKPVPPRRRCSQCRLRQLCLPRELDPQALARLDVQIGHPKPLSRHEILYHQGQTLRELYFIGSGSLKLSLRDDNGTVQILGFYLPGELLGLEALEADRHTATAEALETSTVCSITLQQYNDLCRLYPEFQAQFQHLAGREIRHDHELLLLLGKTTSEERLAYFLCTLSRRFARRGYSSTEFTLSMSRHDIANYLGLAPATISRVLKSMGKQGLVSIDHKLVQIHDPSGIQDMAGLCASCPPIDAVSA